MPRQGPVVLRCTLAVDGPRMEAGYRERDCGECAEAGEFIGTL